VLVELRLENYAVIDNVAVEFAAGLNLLTGETGAGKSILIDALALLLGERASSDVIRSGAEKAVVVAVWELESGAGRKVAEILSENGIDDNSESLILRREVARAAREGYSSTTSPPPWRVLKRLARIWRRSTRRTKRCWLLMPARAFSFSIPSQSVKQKLPRRPLRPGKRSVSVSLNSSATSKTVSACSTSGASKPRNRRSPPEASGGRTTRSREAGAGELGKDLQRWHECFDLLYEGSASTSATLRSASKHVEELSRYEPKFSSCTGSP